MNQKKLSTAKLTINLFLFIAFTIPIITPFDFSYIYILYISAIIIMLIFSPPKNTRKLILHWLIPATVLYSVLVLSHAGDQSSIINLSAVFLTLSLIFLINEKLKRSPNTIIQTINTLPKFALLSIAAYIPISILFSSFLDINNPTSDLITGNRLRLLSGSNTGHSVLISLSFVGLILCYSKISLFSGKLRWPATALFILLLILSKSSVSWLLLLSSTTIFIIESIRHRIGRAATFGYFLLAITLIVALSNFETLMTFFRTDLQGNDTSIYAGDLTAGRAELNSLLISGISTSPLTGLGHGHPMLQSGLKDAAGHGASSESGLRLAAKYGIPYFISILFLISLPFRAFSINNKNLRILSISFSSGLLLMLTANATLEAPHSFEFFFYICLSLILSSAVSIEKKSKLGVRRISTEYRTTRSPKTAIINPL